MFGNFAKLVRTGVYGMFCTITDRLGLPPTPVLYGTEQDMQGNTATSPGILFLASVQSYKVKQYVW